MDKSLKEVREWKKKVARKTSKMAPEEVVKYFNTVHIRATRHKLKQKAI